MNTNTNYVILIVDDQVANLDVLSNLLESQGFNVLAARDGEEALEITRQTLPDLILLDVILPGIDGFETCRRLKADKQTAQIPVIFMTVLEQIEDKVQGFQLGAADYITKPFQAEEVIARITTQLRLRRLTRDLQEANTTLEQRVAERTDQLTQVNQDLQAEVVERKSAEEALSSANEALTRTNRAYRMLSECNQIVVYATEEATFLQKICQAIVVHGDYLRACIDLVEPNEALTFRPVAQAEAEEKHLEQMPIPWSDASHKQVPSAAVIQAGEPIIYQDILSDPDLVFLQTGALEHGYTSTAIFPLLTGEQELIGTLTVYATRADAFAEEEVRLFMELATDMAFGVTTLRTRAERTRAEETVQYTNDLLQAIIEAAPVAIIGLDLDGNVQLVWNPAAEKMLGWDAQEVMGSPLPSVPVERQAEFEHFREQIRQGLTLDGVEVCRQRRDGTSIDYSIYASPLHDTEGHITGNVAVLVDITERKRADAELRKLSRAAEQSPASVVITDTAGRIEYVNPKFTQLTGYTLDEVLGQNPRILKSGHTPPEEYELLWNTIIAGREWRGEFLNKKKNGEFYWEIASISPVRDAVGTITHFIAVKEDITERKQAEEALQDQYFTLRGIIDSAHALIFSVDRQYCYTSFNQRHAAVMEVLYGAEIELGHSLLDYMTVAEDRATAKRNIDRALAGEPLVEEAYSGEEPRSHRYFHVSHSPIQVETDEIIGVAVLAQDITERRWAEEALHESEKRFRLLAENSTDMISLHAPDGTYLYVSPACKPLLGYEPDELVGQSAYDLFYPADVAAIRQSHATMMDHPVPYTVQYRIRHKEGNYRWFETTSQTLHDDQKEAVTEIQAASHDITARKRAEDAEREQRLLATALAKTAEAINSTLDFDEVLERLLDAIKDVVPHHGANIMLLDEHRTELAVVCSCDCYLANGLEKPDADVWQLIQSPDLQQMIDTHEALLIPNTLEYAEWSIKSNPHLIHSYIGMPIIIEGAVIGILNIDSITPDFFAAQHVERLQGFAHQAAIALQNAQLFQQLESYSADLEQAVIERTLELTRTNAELRQLSRIKDEFVSNVSHELKSPITTLMLRHHLLRKHPEDFAQHLDVLERETTRLAQTIEDLLRLSRLDQERTAVKLAPVDLNVMVERLVYDRGLQAQQKELSLTFSGQPNLPVIMADQGLLEQVLSILLTNAIHYTPAAGQISVFTQLASRDATHWVGFGVSDTGWGIPQEEQPRLFERFFQGSANRQSGVPGTGLGLAIAQEIVERHHGRIEVESTGIPGEGTTFRVWLPCVTEEPDIPTVR